MNSPKMNITERKNAISWVKSFILPEKMPLIRVMLLSAFMTSAALAQPYLTKLLIDDGLMAKNMTVVINLALILIFLSALVLILTGFNRWLYVKLSGRILFNLREDVFRHLLQLSPYFYNRWRRGDILARLDGDVAAVQRFSTDSLLSLVNGSLGLIGSLIIMLALSWKLTIIAFILLPLQILFLKFMRPRIERSNRDLREKSSNLSSFLIEKISSVKFIQSFFKTRKEEDNLSSLNEDYLKNLLSLQIINHVTSGVPAFLGIIATAMVFIFGGYYIIQGEESIGTLIAFTAYMGRAAGPLQSFLGLYAAYQRAMVSLVRIKELKDQKVTIPLNSNPVEIASNAAKDLIFKQVSYFHDADQQHGVRDVNMTLKAGTKILISGASGSGKSTLTDLIHRHFDPEKGEITYADIDLKDLSLEQLRSEIVIIEQNITHFRGTFWENITYGVKNATVQQVHNAAQIAQIHDFIMAQPKGYDTLIGEQGSDLSGGQRQRTAIARALLIKPKILILDESTSAIDQKTEEEIYRLIDLNFNSATLIIISHHLGQIGKLDQIYSMTDGRLSKVQA